MTDSPSVGESPSVPGFCINNPCLNDAAIPSLTSEAPNGMSIPIGMHQSRCDLTRIQFFDKWIGMTARVLRPLEPQQPKGRKG